MSNLSTQQVACLSNKKSHVATSCATLNMFNFEQLVAQTIQLAQTGNKLHGNKLHVWTELNCRSAELLSTFKHSLKTELFDIAYRKREHSAYIVSAIMRL